MTAPAVDVVTVGGGLGGAVVGRELARAGRRVVVLEKARTFRDRVRGEVLVPWGGAEARALGLLDLLRDGIGHEVTWWQAVVDGLPVLRRSLPETTLPRLPVVTFFHPAMQEALLGEAAAAGAEVRRGVTVREVRPGRPPVVVAEEGGERSEIPCRLVVGADGRGSAVRKWGGFEVQTEPERRFFGGVLVEGSDAPEDTMLSAFRPNRGEMSWIFPQGGGRVRAYVGFLHAEPERRYQGERDFARFVADSIRIGVPAATYREARPAGPLATFDATENWVEHPYRDGIALVGDAAATTDPTWGQGMSETLRDARILTESLLADEDWEAAGHAYAEAHDEGFAPIHRSDSWYTDLFLDVGPGSRRRRWRALPLLASDPGRIPDAPLSGPQWGATDEMRRRFFAEDEWPGPRDLAPLLWMRLRKLGADLLRGARRDR